ncbi:MAG TPA: methyltransferase domain-containing protein [Sphingopyxis sp.]|nr:methyltransferase domain-containing protein [Sphingopyxis sp.]
MRSLSLVTSLVITASLPATVHSQQNAASADPAATTAAIGQDQASAAILAAVAAPSRTPAHVARDRYRHPAETLDFFGIQPGDTIVELAPGGGWYSEILAPFSQIGGGTLYAAGPWGRMTALEKKQADQPEIYGAMQWAEFPASGDHPTVPDASADIVLTFRNAHNWRAAGDAATAEAFRQIFAMLKPGGLLGLVDHRLDERDDSVKEQTSGYLKESTVIAFAQAAGFQLAARSEINANPRDTKDYPHGVWTLPPVLSQKGQNREAYLAIGESDRMTLKFVKPAS